MRCVIGNPNPVPFDLRVKKGLKIFGKSSGGMPLPVSEIDKET
jgi:hypothetical protein